METKNAKETLTAELFKICTKCNEEKELTEYYLSRGKPQSQCKICARKQKKDYKARKRAEDKAKKIASGEIEVLPEPTVEGNKVCKYCKEEKSKTMFRPKRLKCLDCERADGRDYRKSDYGKLKSKTWVENNRERFAELQADSYQKNKDKINAKYVERCKNDPIFKTRRLNKNITSNAFFLTKETKYVDCLGCTAGLFKLWIDFCLEKQTEFTIDNYGSVWHFDHVIPIGLFDLSDEDQVKQCYNWRNVTPYGGKENLTKNKYVNPEQISFHYENLLEFHKLHKLEFTKKYEDLYAKHLIYAGNPLEP